MTVILDSNIFISALINGEGSEFSILSAVDSRITFISPNLLIEEVNSKIDKITRLTTNPKSKILAGFQFLLNRVTFFDKSDLQDSIIQSAKKIVEDIDADDFLFVAAAMRYDALLWTGDLKLLRGLKRKGFQQVITTKDLAQIINGL